MQEEMKAITAVIFAVLLCGCSTPTTTGSGNVRQVVVSLFEEHGEPFATPSDVPEINARWQVWKNVELMVFGDHGAWLDSLLCSMFGDEAVLSFKPKLHRRRPDLERHWKTLVRTPSGKGIYCQHCPPFGSTLLFSGPYAPLKKSVFDPEWDKIIERGGIEQGAEGDAVNRAP
jgi:hypothetical protein